MRKQFLELLPQGASCAMRKPFYYYSYRVKLTVDSGRMQQSQNYHRTGLVKGGNFFLMSLEVIII